MYMSDSELARGVAQNRGEKGVLKPKAIQWIVIALAITVLFCVVTIFVLFSKLNTVSEQFKTNNYLNPFYFTTSWQQTYGLTPQVLDSNLNYTDLYDDYTAKKYFTWNSQNGGGYGTCEFDLWIKNCDNCHFTVVSGLNGGYLYPSKNITTNTISTTTYKMTFNFVLAQGSNVLGVSLALIGDSSKGPLYVQMANSAYCYVFGVQS